MDLGGEGCGEGGEGKWGSKKTRGMAPDGTPLIRMVCGGMSDISEQNTIYMMIILKCQKR